MPYNSDIHHRRTIRLREYDYSQKGLYFVTICVQNRECLFGEIANGEMMLNDAGKMIETKWLEITQHYPDAILHEYVIMPNHLHGIIELTISNDVAAVVGVQNFEPLHLQQQNKYQKIIPRSIGAIVRGFKIGTTKQFGYSVWQRNYYEHVIRDNNDHARIIEYIINNPANWEIDQFH